MNEKSGEKPYSGFVKYEKNTLNSSSAQLP